MDIYEKLKGGVIMDVVNPEQAKITVLIFTLSILHLII